MTTWDWEYAAKVFPDLVAALRVTIEVTAVGAVLAALLGLALAVAGRSRAAGIRWAVKCVVESVRSTPLLVQLFTFYYGLPAIGIQANAWVTGTLALGLHYASYTSEVYRAGIDAVPKGQWEAATALGFGRRDTWRRVVLPQAVPRVLPALGNYAVAMFKETPLLAVVTIVEVLGTARIVGSESGRYLEPMTIVGVLFLALSLATSALLARLDKRLRPMAGLA